MLPILWLALCLSGLQVRGATRPDSDGPKGSIQGLVVRAGAAALAARAELADAQVELKPGNIKVLTRADGTFTFRNLSPGQYTLSFTREGFIPQEDRRRGITLSGLTVTIVGSEALKDIALPMIPAPAIAGRVIDPHGEPVPAGLVRAYRRKFTPRGPQLKIVKKGMTNDMGEFRLFGLNFADYFISAAYSDRDRAAAIGRTQLSANVARADDGYATVFYDSAEDLTLAQSAHVAPGVDTGSLNIYLRDSKRFSIFGFVVPRTSSTKIMLVPKGGDLAQPDDLIQPSGLGAFEIRGVSPGSYLLMATAVDGFLASDVIEVRVRDADVENVRIPMQETISINGRLFLERNLRADLTGMHVKLLRSTFEFEQEVEALVAADGTFTLDHVSRSAEYDIVVEPLSTGTYVKSISVAARNVLPGKAVFAPNQPLQIALATATDELAVHVKGPDSIGGVQVVLVPQPELRRREDRYFTAFTDKSGDVRLTNVPPGTYTAYAFERIAEGAYYALAYNPLADSRFRERGLPVTIGEGGGMKQIELTVIPASDTAGFQ